MIVQNAQPQFDSASFKRWDRKRIEAALPENDPRAAPLRGVLARVNALREQIAERRTELQETGHYTPEGLAAALAADVDPARAELETLTAQVQSLTESFANAAAQRPALPDPDASLEPYVLQQFLNLSGAQRMAAISRAISGQDPALQIALARAHPRVSGLQDETRNTLLDKLAPISADAPGIAHAQLAVLAADEINNLTSELV